MPKTTPPELAPESDAHRATAAGERAAGDEGEPAAAEEYTIDELTAKTRVPSRTIRFYQSKGVLGPPRMRGRVAYYGGAHVDRLKLIGQLQDRGLRIDGIRELVTRIDKGDVDVGEWLGLDAQLRAPWADDKPRTMAEAEILELARDGRREGLISDLVRARVVQRSGDVFVVESPQMLRLLLKLEASGVSVELGARAAEILRKHLARASKDLAEVYLDQVVRGEEGRDGTLDVVRAVALEAVQLLFAREMEGVVRELVESGKTAKLGAKRRKDAAPAAPRTRAPATAEPEAAGEAPAGGDSDPQGPAASAARALSVLEKTLGRKLFR